MTSAVVQINLFNLHWNRTGVFGKWITSNHNQYARISPCQCTGTCLPPFF